jgi:hypothetical protein
VRGTLKRLMSLKREQQQHHSPLITVLFIVSRLPCGMLIISQNLRNDALKERHDSNVLRMIGPRCTMSLVYVHIIFVSLLHFMGFGLDSLYLYAFYSTLQVYICQLKETYSIMFCGKEKQYCTDQE